MEDNVNKNAFLNYLVEDNCMKKSVKDKEGCFTLKVKSKEFYNSNYVKLSLAFPNPNWITGLWPTGHVTFITEIEGELVARNYTAINSVEQKGHCDFMIKIYRDDPWTEEEEGVFTQWLDTNLKVGDSVRIEGPRGIFKYLGFGNLEYKGQFMKGIKRIAMLAGGTGITPFYSIIQASTLSKDAVKLDLFVSNKTKNDIILKTELDNYIALNKNNISVNWTLTRHNDNYHGKRAGLKGRITPKMLKDANFPMQPSKDTIVLICGP